MGGAGARADWLARPLMRGVIAVVGGNKGICSSGACTIMSVFEERFAALLGRLGGLAHFTTHRKCSKYANLFSKSPTLVVVSPNQAPRETRGSPPRAVESQCRHPRNDVVVVA